MKRPEKLSLLFVIARFHPALGGGEIQARRLAEALVSKGHSVTVMTMRHDASLPSEEVLDGVTVLRRGRNTLAFVVSLLAHLWWANRRYDGLHAFQSLSPALAVALARGLFRRPAVLTAFSGGFAKEEGDLYMALRRSRFARAYPALLRRFDRIVVKSDESAQEFDRLLGLATCLIPNGIDTVKFVPALVAPEKPVACFVGRLEHVKAPEVLFNAWAYVVRVMPEARLLVAGEGRDEGSFRQLVNDLQLESTVTFLGRQEDVRPILQASCLLVLSSRSEGMPGVVLEAMASGLPVVATDVGQLRALIRHGESGIVVAPGMPESLGAAMHQLLADRDLARTMGQTARHLAEEAFCLESMATQYESLYRELVCNKESARR